MIHWSIVILSYTMRFILFFIGFIIHLQPVCAQESSTLQYGFAVTSHGIAIGEAQCANNQQAVLIHLNNQTPYPIIASLRTGDTLLSINSSEQLSVSVCTEKKSHFSVQKIISLTNITQMSMEKAPNRALCAPDFAQSQRNEDIQGIRASFSTPDQQRCLIRVEYGGLVQSLM